MYQYKFVLITPALSTKLWNKLLSCHFIFICQLLDHSFTTSVMHIILGCSLWRCREHHVLQMWRAGTHWIVGSLLLSKHFPTKCYQFYFGSSVEVYSENVMDIRVESVKELEKA